MQMQINTQTNNILPDTKYTSVYDSTNKHKLQEPTEEMVEAGHMAAWSLPEAERLRAASTVAYRGTVVHATRQHPRDPYQERWREAIIIEHRGGQLRPRQ